MELLSPEVEEAVAEAYVLRILDVAIDLDRQGLGDREDLEVLDGELDLVGSLGFTAAGARATTVPVTVTTLSRRSPSAVLKCGLERSNTHWVRP